MEGGQLFDRIKDKTNEFTEEGNYVTTKSDVII